MKFYFLPKRIRIDSCVKVLLKTFFEKCVYIRRGQHQWQMAERFSFVKSFIIFWKFYDFCFFEI